MNRLIIITGASRGIGKTIATEMAKKYKDTNDTIFILMARNVTKLEETKKEMTLIDDKNILLVPIDFSLDLKTNDYLKIIKDSLTSISDKITNFNELFIFYNHGTDLIGYIQNVADNMSNEFITNVTSIWCLMAALMKLFPVDQNPVQFHINMSSLCATLIGNKSSQYSASKLNLNKMSLLI
jgi:short-subunit dehydrogenase